MQGRARTKATKQLKTPNKLTKPSEFSEEFS
jgi:hypothetical protein